MLKPALVCSLFPNVPPTIYFSTRDETGEPGSVVAQGESGQHIIREQVVLAHSLELAGWAGLNPPHDETQHWCEIQMAAVNCAASIVCSMAQAATKCSSVPDLPQLWSLLLHDGSATRAMQPWCLCSKP